MSKAAASLLREIKVFEKQKAEADALSSSLDEKIQTLRRAYDILNGVEPIVLSEGESVGPIDAVPRQRNNYPMPVGDAVERVLHEQGHKLHISEIGRQIGVLLGVTPSRHSLTTIIRKDSRRRFAAFGQGEYGLTEWETLQDNAEPMRLTG